MPVSGRFHVFPADGPAGGPGRWAVSNKPPRGWTKSDEKRMQKERRIVMGGVYRVKAIVGPP
ncbi:MAG: hypothetical protein MUC40_08235, partial [Akkermansiaceae bacterium]|nr:hypothetical protein [Akkermansiaceae bacterium]